MDFQLTDVQTMLRQACRDLLTSRARPADGVGYDDELWRAGAEMGWIGLGIDEDWGGSGQSVVDAALVCEELGQALASGPFAPTMLAALAVQRGADPALRADVLPALVEGEASAAWAFAEPDGPWAAGALRTAIVPSGDSYVLAGVKTAVQDAEGARWLLVTALRAGIPTSVLVDAHAPGVSVRRQHTLDLTRSFYEVHFDRTPVPADRVLRSGTDEVDHLLGDAAVLGCADSLGACQQLVDRTVEYVKVRRQFDRPIGGFQAIKHACANMRIALTAMRAATYAAAMTHAAGAAEAPAAVSAAKAFVSEEGDRLASQALQVHGGIGFTWEHDLHRYLRRVKVNGVLFGDATLHADRLCRLLAAS